MRFTVAELCRVASALVQTHAPTLDSGPRGGLAHDLTDRGSLGCTAASAHDATQRRLRSISNKWGTCRILEFYRESYACWLQ